MKLTKRQILRRLRRARWLVTKGWTQNASARDRQSKQCFTANATAVRWCLSGALTLACASAAECRKHADGLLIEGGDFIRFSEKSESAIFQVQSIVTSVLDILNVMAWNDCPGRTKAEVLEALNKVISHVLESNV